MSRDVATLTVIVTGGARGIGGRTGHGRAGTRPHRQHRVGRRPGAPGAATYSASKFAVIGFSEAARLEFRPHGVDVTVVLPTIVQTELSAGVASARGVRRVTPSRSPT